MIRWLSQHNCLMMQCTLIFLTSIKCRYYIYFKYLCYTKIHLLSEKLIFQIYHAQVLYTTTPFYTQLQLSHYQYRTFPLAASLSGGVQNRRNPYYLMKSKYHISYAFIPWFSFLIDDIITNLLIDFTTLYNYFVQVTTKQDYQISFTAENKYKKLKLNLFLSVPEIMFTKIFKTKVLHSCDFLTAYFFLHKFDYVWVKKMVHLSVITLQFQWFFFYRFCFHQIIQREQNRSDRKLLCRSGERHTSSSSPDYWQVFDRERKRKKSTVVIIYNASYCDGFNCPKNWFSVLEINRQERGESFLPWHHETWSTIMK